MWNPYNTDVTYTCQEWMQCDDPVAIMKAAVVECEKQLVVDQRAMPVPLLGTGLFRSEYRVAICEATAALLYELQDLPLVGDRVLRAARKIEGFAKLDVHAPIINYFIGMFGQEFANVSRFVVGPFPAGVPSAVRAATLGLGVTSDVRIAVEVVRHVLDSLVETGACEKVTRRRLAEMVRRTLALGWTLSPIPEWVRTKQPLTDRL